MIQPTNAPTETMAEPSAGALPGASVEATRRRGAARIIRPDAAGGARSDLNLIDLQRLGEGMVSQTQERVKSLEESIRALQERALREEAAIARRREEAERELEALRRAHEAQAAARRAELEADLDSLRKEARARSVEEGRAEGLAQGQEEGYRKGFESGYAEGREKGYSEGHKAERERIEAEAAPMASLLRALAEEIGLRRRSLLAEAREELLPLAIEIARKLVKKELRECPEVVLLNVRKAIDLAFRRTSLNVQVHPEDLTLVEKYVPDILSAFAGAGDLAVKAAEDVARGGCRVVSGTGVVDLRIESQIEIIEQALFGSLSEKQDEPPSEGSSLLLARKEDRAGPDRAGLERAGLDKAGEVAR